MLAFFPVSHYPLLCPPCAGTTYWLRTYLINAAEGTSAEQGAAEQVTASPVDRTLYAGVYRFDMFAQNSNGDGPISDISDPVTVGACTIFDSLTIPCSSHYQAVD